MNFFKNGRKSQTRFTSTDFIVDDAGEQYLPLSEELEKLELYLSLEKLRFKDKLEYEISISPEIDKYSILIPTMILQPYVENAIWHGIMPLETSEKVSISIEPYNKSSLCIIIEDNVIGRHNTIQLQNCYERIITALSGSV